MDAKTANFKFWSLQMRVLLLLCLAFACSADNGTSVHVQLHMVPLGCQLLGSGNNSGQSYEKNLRHVDVGPYLLRTSSTGVTVRWASSRPLPSCLTLGSAAELLCVVGDCSKLATQHTFRLTGLAPSSRYSYVLGRAPDRTAWGWRHGGGFTTHPAPRGAAAAALALRVWALGDSGTGDGLQRGVLGGAVAFMRGERGHPERLADAALLLGDNAYHTGSADEFRRRFFKPYRRLLPHLPLWPVVGNHDTYSFAQRRRPFFQLFDARGSALEGPGAPSNTSAYYSWNWGSAHFVALETNHAAYCRDRRAGASAPPRFDCAGAGWALGEALGDQERWLQADLAAAGAAGSGVRWLVAYLHHSPYMRGDHNSDDTGREPQSQLVRARLLPKLEAAGVDLVLSGHSHSYQRMCMLDGIYGGGAHSSGRPHQGVRSRGSPAADAAWRAGDAALAHSLTPGGSVLREQTAVFRKSPGLQPHGGAIYIVAGSGGKLTGPRGWDRAWGSPQYPARAAHPASCVSRVETGSLVLDFAGDVLEGAFVSAAGAVADKFVIDKRGAAAPEYAAVGVARPRVAKRERAGAGEGGKRLGGEERAEREPRPAEREAGGEASGEAPRRAGGGHPQEPPREAPVVIAR